MVETIEYSLVVLTSIVAHGVTDTPGANWIAQRSAPDNLTSEAEPAPAGVP